MRSCGLAACGLRHAACGLRLVDQLPPSLCHSGVPHALNPFPADIADLRRCFGLFPLPTANCQLLHCQIHFPQISQIYAVGSVFLFCQLPTANCAFLPAVLRSCGLAVLRLAACGLRLAACGLRLAACGPVTLPRSVTPASPPCIKSISRRYRRFTQMLRSFSFANCQLPTASLSNPFPADIADLRRWFGLFVLPTANCQLPTAHFCLRSCGLTVLRSHSLEKWIRNGCFRVKNG